MFSINAKGVLHQFNEPIVMGIVNATPDSFYKGDLQANIIELVGKMIENGANIIDIGGQSTNPNSTLMNAAEEKERVLPVIETVRKNFPKVIISVDTFYADVAVAAVKAGADIINDISAGNMDTAMITTVAELKVPYILMHMQGTPQTMQDNPSYKNVVAEVYQALHEKVLQCRKAGIKDVIIDPGFGFGKTITHNFSLLKHLSFFNEMGLPVLAGLSRKSMIYKTLNSSTAEALNGTTALNMLALANGAAILRVHDVKEAKECIDLYCTYKKAP